MFVELHILQNFAPSNLNRDDTGSPKSAEFGGVRRARISSQCIKRAVRSEFRTQHLLPEEHLAERTKRVVNELADRVGGSREEARPVIEVLLRGARLAVQENTKEGGAWKTQYLLYLGRAELDRIAELCRANWETLLPLALPAADATGGEPGRRTTARQRKSAGAQTIPPDLSRALLDALDGGKAADLALFGRMLADLPDRNIDAAAQVAHALSTHRVSTEFDFYTAVDDLRPEDTEGADMLGTVEFNSACYYRYANVDLGQLERNLGGDRELAHRTLGAFLRGSVDAVPTGKQNGFAALNPPSLVLVAARDGAPCSLANAFEEPVRPGRDRGLVRESVRKLDAYWGALAEMYGARGARGAWLAALEPDALQHLAGARLPGVDAVIGAALATVAEEGASR